MRRYETITIVKPNLGEDSIQAVIDKTTGIIEGFGGSIVRVDKWGLKKLAYLIQKEQQGFYIYIEYAGSPAAVEEIERVFRIDDQVMKFMTVKLQDVFTALPEDTPAEEAAEEPKETATVETAEQEKPAETGNGDSEAS